MPTEAQYRVEHVAETPRGYHVRTIAPGPRSDHLIRVAFPKGRRRRGSGQLVEILHPPGERNPKCELSRKAQANPSELLMFTNPSESIGEHRGVPMIYEGISYHAPSLKLRGFSTDLELKRAIDRKLKAAEKKAAGNPIDTGEMPELMKLWHTARIPLGSSASRYDRLTWAANEWNKTHPGQRTAAYKALDRQTRGYGNPKRKRKRNAYNENNVRHLIGIYQFRDSGQTHSDALLKTLTDYHASDEDRREFKRRVSRAGFGLRNAATNRYGVYSTRETGALQLDKVKGSLREADKEANRLRSAGYAAQVVGPRQFFNKRLNPTTQEKKRAARERAARIRAARLNPRHKTIPQLLKECDQLKKALSYRAGNPKRAELKKKLQKIEAQFYPAMDRLAAARRAGGVMSPEYIAIEKETDKLGRELDSLKRQHAAAFNPRRNPDNLKQAVTLYESFHGKSAREVIERHRSAAMRLDYAVLGTLVCLEVITPIGGKVQFGFEGDHVKLASSPDGKQLYCIGGNQNLERCLDADSLQKDLIDLGECQQVEYLARKIHGNFEPIEYYHKFGEARDGSTKPMLMYDKLKREIFFVGGQYFIDAKMHTISPGIEN